MIKQLISSINNHFNTYRNGLTFFVKEEFNKVDTTDKLVVSTYGPIFTDGFVYITVNCLIRINIDENDLYKIDTYLDYLKDYYDSISIYDSDGIIITGCLDRSSELEIVKIGIADGMLEAYLEAEFKTME